MKEKLIDERKAADGIDEPEFSGLTMQSGNTTYVVGLHFSESCKETLEDKLKKLIRKDVEADNF